MVIEPMDKVLSNVPGKARNTNGLRSGFFRVASECFAEERGMIRQEILMNDKPIGILAVVC